MDSLSLLAEAIADCRQCERLVQWREKISVEKRAAFIDDEYWGRGVPGFGDPLAKVMIIGLAPAAHGANRTGRDLRETGQEISSLLRCTALGSQTSP